MAADAIAAWERCDDPALLRGDADYHRRQAQLLAEKANEVRARADWYTAEAARMDARAAELEVADG